VGDTAEEPEGGRHSRGAEQKTAHSRFRGTTHSGGGPRRTRHASGDCRGRPVQGYPNRWELVRFDRLTGNRPGSGSDRYETGQYSKFKFEIKKMKNSQKIPKNTSRCEESNGVKLSQKFAQ